jgi:hypothetical protein
MMVVVDDWYTNGGVDQKDKFNFLYKVIRRDSQFDINASCGGQRQRSMWKWQWTYAFDGFTSSIRLAKCERVGVATDTDAELCQNETGQPPQLRA